MSGMVRHEDEQRVLDKIERLSRKRETTGSLPAKWRRLAESLLLATDNMKPYDHCRMRAETRAQAYKYCADELEANDKLTGQNGQGETNE